MFFLLLSTANVVVVFTAAAAWTVAVVVVNFVVDVVDVVSISRKCLPFYPCSNTSTNIHALPEQVYFLPWWTAPLCHPSCCIE